MTGSEQPAAMQSPQNVAFRALCLGGLVMRSVLEGFFHHSNDPADRWTDQVGIRELTGWMAQQGLFAKQTEDEKKLFRHELGRWDEDYLSQATWRVEALGVLLWALGIIDALPAYDTLFPTEEMLEAIPIYQPIRAFVTQAVLRPPGEIKRAHQVCTLWEWRSRAARLQQLDVAPPEGTTYEELITRTARQAHRAGALPPLIEDDFPAFGKPYLRLTGKELSQARMIVVQRCTALHWLLNRDHPWETG